MGTTRSWRGLGAVVVLFITMAADAVKQSIMFPTWSGVPRDPLSPSYAHGACFAYLPHTT